MGLGLCGVHAGTVAHWHFDEPGQPHAGKRLEDAGEAGRFLLLGEGGELVTGRKGRGLRPVVGSRAGVAQGGGEEARRWRQPAASVTDSRLNLGAGDWTLEGWLSLDREADSEGVIFEIADGEVELLATRFSVSPGENAFILRGLFPLSDAPNEPVSLQVEFANAEGPPHGRAAVRSIPFVPGETLPRGRWFHVALVHATGSGLRLLMDGRIVAAVAVSPMALPRSERARITVGCDGDGGRRLPGVIDELRVSDHAQRGEEHR